ncbi:MAG: DUF2313 domain-containing protein [Desulfobacterales bacterium]|nr:DUF2313 domain-containing protein [Desulfobacterales bacterium]
MKNAKSRDYLKLLQALLPVGNAWPREFGTVMSRLLLGMSDGYQRVHNYFLNIIEESDPRTANITLVDWERFCGIKDPQNQLQDRRNEVVTILISKGGQSKAYFEKLTELMGYEVEISERRPFVCGASEVGEIHELGGGYAVNFLWDVIIKGQRITWFRCSESECGDHFAEISGAEKLEELLRKYQPAQSKLIIGYE